MHRACSLLLLTAGLAGAQEAPRFGLAGDRLTVTALPPILEDQGVGRHLRSGLTTTFALATVVNDRSGHRVVGSTRLAIRYEPWDEIFIVSLNGTQTQTMDSLEALLEWWHTTQLELLPVADLEPEDSWRIKLEIGVIPFSRAEQRDAQRWLSGAVGSSQGSSSEVVAGAAEEGAPAPGGRMLDLLVATSIKRRSLLTYRWTLTLNLGRRD